ncbi:uncharacterized protein N7515_000812 [Penicillium bovifimosum]|uniref:Uncharacterized protein n=1 Tax=Penicillium bovifimosum TaxID=126998 RepID=A0A9W9HGH8_9EURO|nr:uncharacterized protein N7515_000812 [Penicillium bovifimosum]KAJ5146248.1 hypothetical protein N7515_000812 [Penicillium bovifimosum]
MERKLSAKAKMRRRLTFSRSNSEHTRDRSLTVVSPSETSRPDSRPRSASSPQSPTQDEPTWDSNRNSSRGYSFTDEPGYFRPDSPLIDRQEVEEDLEADIKHACALLSHSIDRGIPAGLSYQSAVPDWTNGNKIAGQPTANIAPSSLEQDVPLLSAPKPTDPGTDSTKKHDSGVSMSFNSPGQQRRPYGNSVSGTDTRFYNKQSQSQSASPPHSLAATIEEDWKRSYTSSLDPFPYSPPNQHNNWTTDPLLDSPVSPVSPPNEPEKLEPVWSNTRTSQNHASNKPDPSPISPLAPSLGEAGRTWLRASKNLEEERPKPSGRFYSSNSRTITASDSRQWKDSWEERVPSLYGDASMGAVMGNGSRNGSSWGDGTKTPKMGSLSTDEDSSGAYPYRVWAGNGHDRGMSCASLGFGVEDGFKHRENVYVVPSERSRWKKASVLFRRLAGLRRRKGEKSGSANGDGDVVC